MLPITAIEEAFVAGPAIRNTNTAPGETPFMKRTNAIGIDAVAQTYKGRETMSITKYSKKEFEDKKEAIKSGGMKYPMHAAISNP